MKKTLLLLLIVLGTLLHIQAQDQKLSGTIIGTKETYDYTTFSCSTTVNTITNAFDDNFDTFFSGCERDKIWVGWI